MGLLFLFVFEFFLSLLVKPRSHHSPPSFLPSLPPLPLPSLPLQEVARIEMQAAASAGEASRTMVQVMQSIVKTEGMPGLFKGVIPRVFLGIWQTLFMVTGAKLVKNALEGGGKK